LKLQGYYENEYEILIYEQQKTTNAYDYYIQNAIDTKEKDVIKFKEKKR